MTIERWFCDKTSHCCDRPVRRSAYNVTVYDMTDEERRRRGIGGLPSSLWEAIQPAEKSELVLKALGEHVFKAFIENKKMEWDPCRYRIEVTEYELKRYLPML